MLSEIIEDPLASLVDDQARAGKLGDPLQGFATLATAEAGQPAARMVTVRRVTKTEVFVSANASSPKAKALLQNPRCELLIYWASLKRQYRLSGSADFLPATHAMELYRHSPWGSKAWDQLYEETPQSSVVNGREDFVTRFRGTLETLQERFGRAADVPAPRSAGYLVLRPTRVEIQELDTAERLHDRRLFELSGEEGWRQRFLLP